MILCSIKLSNDTILSDTFHDRHSFLHQLVKLCFKFYLYRSSTKDSTCTRSHTGTLAFGCGPFVTTARLGDTFNVLCTCLFVSSDVTASGGNIDAEAAAELHCFFNTAKGLLMWQRWTSPSTWSPLHAWDSEVQFKHHNRNGAQHRAKAGTQIERNAKKMSGHLWRKTYY